MIRLFTEKGRVILADALYNLHPQSGASEDYCKGIVLGMVTALMARGDSFNDALANVAMHVPYGVRIIAPDAWQQQFTAEVLSTQPPCPAR